MICSIKIKSENMKMICTVSLFPFDLIAIFLNVMVLQFWKQYLSNSMVLSLLPLLCNHGSLTLNLHQKI